MYVYDNYAKLTVFIMLPQCSPIAVMSVVHVFTSIERQGCIIVMACH